MESGCDILVPQKNMNLQLINILVAFSHIQIYFFQNLDATSYVKLKQKPICILIKLLMIIKDTQLIQM
ncbi:hypothetical protein pb186bvf_007234 [Paramecium bursaria]